MVKAQQYTIGHETNPIKVEVSPARAAGVGGVVLGSYSPENVTFVNGVTYTGTEHGQAGSDFLPFAEIDTYTQKFPR